MPNKKLPKCPKCNARLIAQPEKHRLWCQICGHVQTDSEAQALIAEYVQSGGKPVYVPEYKTTNRFLSNRQMAVLCDAWRSIHRGDKKGARYQLQELLTRDPNLTDAYYLLALASETLDERAQYLIHLLSIDPYHEQANFELAKIKGDIPADAEASFATLAEHQEEVEGAVDAKGKLEECPMCGGRTLYTESNKIKCTACGYTPQAGQKVALGGATLRTSMSTERGYHSLQSALMQRKYGYAKEWVIAKRVLICQNCGAELTLSRNMMTQQCAFCDSQHILVQDEKGSFQEPDAVIPVRLNSQDADKVMLHALPLEVRQAVIRREIVGIFLPVWAFRGMVNVEGVRGTDKSFVLENILVSGGNEPNQRVMEDIQPYTFKTLYPYDQRYLAQWSAQLYTQDAIQASVTANAFAKFAALRMALGYSFPDGFFARSDRNYDVPGYSLFHNTTIVGMLEYRLMLLPVWMTTMHLQRGGYYHSFINAQTGEVVITERVDSKGGYSSQDKHSTSSAIRPISPNP